MTFTYGKNIRISLFGESHGAAIGITADGLPAGLPVDVDYMVACLDRRKPWGDISTARRESDIPHIISGVTNGHTNGSPLTIVIYNEKHNSDDYKELALRPSHADYTAHVKLGGFNDYHGGGSFSGRMTAPIVAFGSVVMNALKAHNIHIGTHISQCGEIHDAELPEGDDAALLAELETLGNKQFAVLDDEKGEEMQTIIREAKEAQDSVGGTLETAIVGLPVGMGSPFFNSIESMIAHLAFSIPGVKGVEFGMGFGFAYLNGSEANDQFVVEEGAIRTKSNFSGGINGGISNGMPVLFRTAFRPTPSIGIKQQTVDIKTMEERELELKGRHDPAIFHRACVVMDAVAAIAMFDLMLERGSDIWKEQA